MVSSLSANDGTPSDRFDVAIIGAGPASLACLDALAGTKTTALITGETAAKPSLAKLHPKIQTVAAERNEPAGVAELFASVLAGAKPLFDTAAVGGLANYWGQQAVSWRRSEPWPSELFRDYEDYETEIGLIERLFAFNGGERITTILPGKDYVASTPRLLAGTRGAPQAGLESMRAAISELAAQHGVITFPTRAIRILRDGTLWAIQLETGQRILAKRVIIAAGVIGSARLMMRSFEDLTGFQFTDHTPWMLYTFGLRRFVASVDSREHFNAISIEKIVGDNASTFASLYDMSQANLNLILSAVFGRNFPRLGTWPSPPGASLLNPVQVWTPSTTDEIEVTADGHVSALPRHISQPLQDFELAGMIDVLAKLGGHVLKISRTSPGEGFHYHNLRVRAGTRLFQARELLAKRTGGEIVCADASILSAIGCRPHSLTAMASARRITSRLISS